MQRLQELWMRLDEAREISHLRHGVVVRNSRPMELGHQADRLRQDRVDRTRKQKEEGTAEGTLEVVFERVTPVPVQMGRLADDRHPARVRWDPEFLAQAPFARRGGARIGAADGAPVTARGGGSIARQERHQRQDAERRAPTPDHAVQGSDMWPTLRVACACRTVCKRAASRFARSWPQRPPWWPTVSSSLASVSLLPRAHAGTPPDGARASRARGSGRGEASGPIGWVATS